MGSDFFPILAIGAFGVAHRAAQSSGSLGSASQLEAVLMVAALAACGFYFYLKKRS
jgi:hypothetical protein